MEIKLITGANLYTKKLLSSIENINKLKQIVWFSNDWVTANHYSEGSILEFTIDIKPSDLMIYVENEKELPQNYTYGKAEIITPQADWYSFSRDYLGTHTKSIKCLSEQECKQKYKGNKKWQFTEIPYIQQLMEKNSKT